MRKLTALLSAAVLAGTLGACSSSGKDGSTSPPPASGTSSSGTGHSGSTGGIDAAQLVSQATAATQKAQTVKIKEVITLLGAPITVSGAVRVDDETVDASVSSTTPVGPVQVILVGGDVYTKGLDKGEPGRPWVKNAGEAKVIAGALQKADPRQTLQMLSSVGTLTPQGTQTINGVQATRYSVTLDLARVAQQHPDLAHLVQELVRAGVKVQDVQVWVDSQERPVRMVTSVQLPDTRNPGKKTTSSQTVDYYDWGAPVRIAAPPADQVTER